MDARRSLLLRFYKALDSKDVEGVAAVLHPDVDFPDQLNGGRLTGAAAVRDYFAGAFDLINSENAVSEFRSGPDGTMEARVHHHVTSLEGRLWHDGPVDYRFTFRDGLIARVDRLDEG